MPYLVLTPLWDSSAQKLRKAANDCGWNSLRLEDIRLPDWFEIEDNEKYVTRGPAVKVFDVAKLFSVKLLCCDAYLGYQATSTDSKT
ncbi:MAG: hypothetical protein HUU50_00380 [Candidatus Brocadiae bacterium]|nr:hypothetical protein [Candidatus Brocadiia bacterium]